MALVLEDGTGVSGADSYVDATYVGTFLLEYVGATAKAAWDAEASEQDRRCREGSAYVDGGNAGAWRGTRAHETQGRDWPRVGAVDDDGYVISSTVIPLGVKQASAYASYAGISTPLTPSASATSSLGAKTIKAGPVTISKTFSGGGESSSPTFSRIDAFLSGLVESAGEMFRA